MHFFLHFNVHIAYLFDPWPRVQDAWLTIIGMAVCYFVVLLVLPAFIQKKIVFQLFGFVMPSLPNGLLVLSSITL